jgi:competence protein ComEA
MRSRRSHQAEVTEVARRRLELLSAELAEIRPAPVDRPGTVRAPAGRAGSGEPPGSGSAFEAPLGEDEELEPWDPLPDPVPARLPWPVPAARPAPVERSGPPAPREHLEPPVRREAAGRHAQRPLGPARSVWGWVQDRLPATVQGRGELGGAHLVVVIGVLAVAVVVTGWWLLRADGGAELPPVASAPSVPATASGTAQASAAGPGLSTGAGGIPVPATGAAASGPAVAGPAASAPSDARVVVDVTGKVRRPGIATLPAGARVVDALEAAGGARRGVALGSLNLARPLTDGEQIVVGLPAVPGVAAPAASAPTAAPGAVASGAAVPMVDINTAGQPELEQLPGIGPVTAQSILAFRGQHGTFTSVDELLEVSGIGDATLARIAPYVTL